MGSSAPAQAQKLQRARFGYIWLRQGVGFRVFGVYDLGLRVLYWGYIGNDGKDKGNYYNG